MVHDGEACAGCITNPSEASIGHRGQCHSTGLHYKGALPSIPETPLTSGSCPGKQNEYRASTFRLPDNRIPQSSPRAHVTFLRETILRTTILYASLQVFQGRKILEGALRHGGEGVGRQIPFGVEGMTTSRGDTKHLLWEEARPTTVSFHLYKGWPAKQYVCINDIRMHP